MAVATLWRTAAETRTYPAADMSGTGAARSPGRWNARGEPAVYCASSISLAALETVAHLDLSGLPQNRFLVEILVPEGVWAKRETWAAESLDPAWEAIPSGRTSVALGSSWLASLRCALLLVPSVIVPEEQVALINPRHPDASRITGHVKWSFEYNRFFRG